MGVGGGWRCNAFVNFSCFVIFRSRVEDWIVLVVVVVVSLDWTAKYGFCGLEHLGVAVLIGPSNPFGHRCGTLL